jgi:Zn-dependent protease
MEPQFEVLPPPRPPPPPPRGRQGGIIGLLVAGVAGMFKFAAPLLVLVKSGGTMLLSIGAYSLIFGWKFAAGFVVLIFVHELGHVVAARAYGLPVSAPMFIPFYGAYVMLRRPLDSYANAVISFAGPLAGGLGGWAAYYLGERLDSEWLLAVALYTFVINLFNLLPVVPLDGSHVWPCLVPRWRPELSAGDRIYLGIFTAAIIAGLVLGMLLAWGNLPPPSDLAPR